MYSGSLIEYLPHLIPYLNKYQNIGVALLSLVHIDNIKIYVALTLFLCGPIAMVAEDKDRKTDNFKPILD